MERFFRNGKPVPASALLAANFALVGGAGGRLGAGGGDVFFARDGMELHFDCTGICILGKDTCALDG